MPNLAIHLNRQVNTDGLKLNPQEHLAPILAEFSAPQRVLYFGDLDPRGLEIPNEAPAKALTLSLSGVEPDLWSYAQLLRLGQNKEVPCETTDPVSPAALEWLSRLAEPARQLLNSGKRLAQEHVGWEFLSAQTTWSSC